MKRTLLTAVAALALGLVIQAPAKADIVIAPRVR